MSLTRSAVRQGLLVLALATLAAAEARAHSEGQSYLYLQVYEDRIDGRFEIALADLNHDLELEGTDREVTPENLDDRVGFLKDYYRRKVKITHEGRPLVLEFTTHGVKGRREPYAYLSFDLGGLDAVPETLTFEYSVLLDENPEHRGFLLVEHNWATGTFANEAGFSRVFQYTSTVLPAGSLTVQPQ